jgi:D-3-phosphoglycerate dehydrogenase
MIMPKVLIAPSVLARLNGDFAKVLQKAGLDLVYPPRAVMLTEPEAMEILHGVEASLASSEPYNAKILEAHPQLKVIARVGVGYDAVDVEAATRLGKVVTITPNTNQGSVAEHTFTLMLALVKHLISQHAGVAAGGWPRNANIPLRGQTLGLAGLGRIGKAVATRALAFEMKVIAYDPHPDTAWAKQYGIPLVSFEDLLKQSDMVSLHLPITPQTRHMINKQTLALMKPTAYLINTARGGHVCEADLLEALKSKKIAGAGLDVFEQEPTGHNPLCQLPNVVVTPHAAGVDTRSRDDMARSAAEAIASLFRGEWPEEKIVNPSVKSIFNWTGKKV